MRQTSLDTFNHIKENGLLSRRRWQVYDVLFYHGPLTANEVDSLLRKIYKDRKSFNCGSSPRLNELFKMGCIFESSHKVCSITGMTAINWDVTDRIPIKLKKIEKTKCYFCNGKGYINE